MLLTEVVGTRGDMTKLVRTRDMTRLVRARDMTEMDGALVVALVGLGGEAQLLGAYVSTVPVRTTRPGT